MEETLNEILNKIEKAKIESFTSKTRNLGSYRIGLTKAYEIVNDIILERCKGECINDSSGLNIPLISGSVVFSAKMIKDGEIVTSKSIINEHGKVYLKHPIHTGQWIECYPDSLTTNR